MVADSFSVRWTPLNMRNGFLMFSRFVHPKSFSPWEEDKDQLISDPSVLLGSGVLVGSGEAETRKHRKHGRCQRAEGIPRVAVGQAT